MSPATDKDTGAQRDDKQSAKRRALAQVLAAHLLREGLIESSLRTLAKAAKTSDRMLVYYFETKDQAIKDALEHIVDSLTTQLDALVPEPQIGSEELLRRMRAAASDPALQPVFQLWFEIVGRAARGEAPYADIARRLALTWEVWIASKLRKAQAHKARDLLARLEGRIMLDLIS